MADISKNEMLSVIKYNELNSKCNNYFFFGVTDIPTVLKDIPKESLIPNYHMFKYESNIGDNHLQNVIVDMSKTPIEELLNKAFEINVTERIPYQDVKDCFRLQKVLRDLKKNVQYIFYNVGELSYEDVKRFNDLILFTTYYINEIVLFKPGEDLVTYQTTMNRVIDYRENYHKVKVRG